MKKNKQIKDEINAVKAKQRSDEIEHHGKMLSYWTVYKDKTKYTRKVKHKNRKNYEI